MLSAFFRPRHRGQIETCIRKKRREPAEGSIQYSRANEGLFISFFSYSLVLPCVWVSSDLLHREQYTSLATSHLTEIS